MKLLTAIFIGLVNFVFIFWALVLVVCTGMLIADVSRDAWRSVRSPWRRNAA